LQIQAGYEDHPVVGVSWFGAEAFAADAGKRLPTEEEWERAARGVDGREYPWRGEFSKRHCNTGKSGIGSTTPVSAYPSGVSVCGARDMSGNVFEWTSTDWDFAKVLRGGCFVSYPDLARCAFRFWDIPDNTNSVIGFRCART
jgi:formylglycine-generating enzyme required for sulfatase activity